MPKITIGRSHSDLVKFGPELGTAYLGRSLVGEKREAHAANMLRMDISRPHVIGVFGKRGSGKCLTGDTQITLADGRTKRLDELTEEKSELLALNKNLKIDKVKKDEFFSRTVEKILRIKLRSGKEIKLTPEHPLLTINGWKPAENLVVGSRIATPRKLINFEPANMPNHEIKLLAYLIAEGHLGNGFVLFANKDEKIKKDFFESVVQFDKNLRIKEHGKENTYRVVQKNKVSHTEEITDKLNRKSKVIRYDKSSIRSWLEDYMLYGKLSCDKFIPENIFKLSDEQLALFLNRLFSCDGSLYNHKTKSGDNWQISYSSCSKELIKQVQHLLLRFGILSRIRRKKTKNNSKLFISYEIVIGAQFVKEFIEKIGFFGTKKNRESQAIRRIEQVKRNTNVDTIPKELWEFYKPSNWATVGRALRYTSFPKAARESQRYCPSRQKLLQIALADNAPEIKMIAKSDIFWDEILEIKIIEGEVTVYDISVPKVHNFIANDILVHNSYTLAVIAEELMNAPPEVKNNLSVIIVDTMGIYWAMKYPNDQEAVLLEKWNLKPQGIEMKHYIPEGQVKSFEKNNIPYDKTFMLNPGDLDSSDWAMAFEIKPNDPMGILLDRAIRNVRETVGDTFSVDEIIKSVRAIHGFTDKEKEALVNRFFMAKDWGVFSKNNTNLDDLMLRGKVSVLDISLYGEITGGWSVRSLVVGLLGKKILRERMQARRVEEIEEMEGENQMNMPIVWMILDEAHTFAPRVGQTPASIPLQQWVKLGRQPGVSLVVATQMPNKLHEDIIAQMDLVISHRLTASSDLASLREIMQTYMRYDLSTYIDNLPRKEGAAICLDDNSERLYALQVRPRYSWHGGSTPTAIKTQRKLLD